MIQSRMRPGFPHCLAALGLIILCLIGSGCVHFGTPAEREASFAPFKEAKVGATGLREYLIARSAILLQAGDLEATNSSTNFLWIADARTVHACGMAAAIDRRGYFLTAAHCVKAGQIWLIFPRAGKLQLLRARVVWSGWAAKRGPDLAVVKVASPLDEVFDWTAEDTNGNRVVAVGASSNPHSPMLKRVCLAGKILWISGGDWGLPPAVTIIAHDAPLHRGDSGGPLASPEGRLLGIDVSVEPELKWRRLTQARALRPDLEWLRRIIDQDAAS